MLEEEQRANSQPAESRSLEVLPCDRRLLFISHAAPQDNLFAMWLASQLASAGYEIWCDVTKLLGGEVFWKDITEAIEKYAFRVFFVSTLEANRKPGTLREMKIALETEQNLKTKDFFVPLKIDQFPYASMNEAIRERNCIPFEENWANGLAQLLKLLERDGAPRSHAAGPECVLTWYRQSQERQRRVVVSDEKCFTNWFRLRLPKHVRFHRFSNAELAIKAADAMNFVPHRVHADHIATFASAHEMAVLLEPAFPILESNEVSTENFIDNGWAQLNIQAFDARNIVTGFIQQAWAREMAGRGLQSLVLASGLSAWFFKADQLPKNRASFLLPGRRKTYRQLVGLKSRRKLDGTRVRDGYWHYAVSTSAQLFPRPRLVLRHHVIFTDDGTKPWEDAGRMHRARRRVCKSWWNPEWRDRLFAFSAWLSQGANEVSLSVSQHEAIRMSAVPTSLVSPWTYCEDGNDALDEANEIELVEDDEADDDNNEAKE